MKTMTLIVLGSLLMLSCSKENLIDTVNPNAEEKSSQNESGFGESLDIRLENLVLTNIYETNEVEQMWKDIADFVYQDDEINEEQFADVPEKGIIEVRKVLSTKTGKMDAYSVVLLLQAVDIADISLAACDPETKNCCSRSCVADIIEKIYSGDRDISVSYRRGVCRTITWAYQGC